MTIKIIQILTSYDKKNASIRQKPCVSTFLFISKKEDPKTL